MPASKCAYAVRQFFKSAHELESLEFPAWVRSSLGAGCSWVRICGESALAQVSVLLAGMLTGMGHTAPCEIIAKKNPVGADGRVVYSDVVILHASADLPNGHYTLTFDQTSLPVTRVGVLWTVRNEPLSAAGAASSQPAVAPGKSRDGSPKSETGAPPRPSMRTQKQAP